MPPMVSLLVAIRNSVGRGLVCHRLSQLKSSEEPVTVQGAGAGESQPKLVLGGMAMGYRLTVGPPSASKEREPSNQPQVGTPQSQ